MSKAIVRIDIPTDYADEYKEWIIDGRLYYLEDGAWTFLKEVECKVEPYKDEIQLNLRVPSNEIVKAVENSVIDTLYAQPPVEAIPVEWIKKYYTDITLPCTDTRIQFEEMIRKWEKENEIN